MPGGMRFSRKGPPPVQPVDVHASVIELTGLAPLDDVREWLRHRGYQAVEAYGGVLFAKPGGPVTMAVWGQLLAENEDGVWVISAGVRPDGEPQ